MIIQTRAKWASLLDASFHGCPEAVQSLSVSLEKHARGWSPVWFIGLSSQLHPLKPVGAWITLPLPSVLPLEAAPGATVKGSDGWGHLWALGQPSFSIFLRSFILMDLVSTE